MSNIVLPRDPLLQRAVAAPDVDMFPPPDGGARTNEQSGIDTPTPGANDPDNAMLPQARGSQPGAPLPSSLLQYVSGLISSKKLSSASNQELYRFATASEPEREMMHFALGLELRDGISSLIATAATAGIHPDLLVRTQIIPLRTSPELPYMFIPSQKNIRRFAAAGFFSPRIAYYTAPGGARRSKNLQNSIYDALVAAKVAHLPADGDQALKDKVLQAIGREFTIHRSGVKDEIAKRKPGEPKTDIASFATTLMRNTTIKITREHYGRIALLSREYRTWSDRESIPDISEAAMKLGYWEWVDATLETVRNEIAASARDKTEALQSYFEEVIKSDEMLFSKAVGKAREPRERETWQANVESAMGRLVAN
ncbi:hypothetical protein FS749_001315 [Ceratobasidium sp. UAMH 11750]|nr:hypothetical protein FS749_001315 [Ceratobasidium sp. UAMH 11750]